MPAEVAHIPSPVPPPLPPGVATSSVSAPGERDPSLCANCDTPLRGPFCSQCGQHVSDIHRSVWRFVADFFDNVFGWDTKVFRTLKPLVTRPGTLTLDYLAGRRARYVHPLRLFLFTSAICLTIIQYFGSNPIRITGGKSANKKHHKADFNIQVGDPSPTPAPAAGDDSPTPGASAAPTAVPAAPTAAEPTPGNANDHAAKSSKDLADALDLAAAKIRQASAGANHPAAAGEASLPPNEELADQIARSVEIARKAEAAAKTGAGAESMKEMTGGDQRRVSWVALALLPIFAVMLRSLYWRLDSYYFAHFVFSLHYHTFLLLFFVAYTLLHVVLPTSFGLVDSLLHLCLLLPGVYLFIALRRLYAESVGRTLAKVLLLGAMHVSVLALGLTMVHASSAFGVLG